MSAPSMKLIGPPGSELRHILTINIIFRCDLDLPSTNLIRPPSTELLQFLTGYVTLRCDLDLLTFDLGVMSHDATWVVDPCTKFEHDTTYRSRVRTTTIFR